MREVALVLLIGAVASGVLARTGLAREAGDAAQLLLVLFLICFVAIVVADETGRHPPQ